MAQLYRDKLDDLERAVELFNEALDLNPGYLEAFERINKILTAQKDWKQLERAYRKMLHRLSPRKGNNDLEYNLWHSLGLIYRDRLEDRRRSRPSAWPRGSSPTRPSRAPDLGRALRADGQLRRGDRRAFASAPRRSRSASTRTGALPALLADADYDRAWCMCRGPVVPPQGRRRRAALLRGLPPARHAPSEEPARQRAVGEEPLPRGREPLHRQDLRDDRHAPPSARRSSAQGEEGVLRRRSKQLPSRPGDLDGHLRAHVRLGGAGPRHAAARCSTCAATCPALS
jgi:hypothetical protein